MPAASGGKSVKLDTEAQAAAELEQTSGPYRMAEHLICDDIIDHIRETCSTDVYRAVLDSLDGIAS